MFILAEVKKNSQVVKFIKETNNSLALSGYTEHGLNHANLVAERARTVAKGIGLNLRDRELCAIAGFCHDMANFLSRTYHHYLGGLLFHQIFQNDFSEDELATIMQAISNHDKEEDEVKLSHPVTAVLVLADKSDVRRSRVTVKKIDEIKADIHDRVNYATQKSDLKVNKARKKITLNLEINTRSVPVMEYFEIFTERMVYCRKAAEYLGYQFELIINKFKLL